ncbi:MAG: hypothetical protein H0X73_09830 [Chthoniobacterales bacterium]|nr:hypothetical protein [Chthoniobacterales bacterium]
MKTFHSLFVVAAALLSLPVGATTVVPPSFDELVTEAETIFQGTCMEAKSQWIGEGAQRHIVTYVTFRVEEVLKGKPGATYTLRMLGGKVDDTTMEVSDSPKFKPGNRDILFVEHNGEQFIPLVGIMHGRYRVERDQATGEEVVLTNHGSAVTDVNNVGKDERDTARVAGKALAPGQFKAAIRAKLGTQR